MMQSLLTLSNVGKDCNANDMNHVVTPAVTKCLKRRRDVDTISVDSASDSSESHFSCSNDRYESSGSDVDDKENDEIVDEEDDEYTEVMESKYKQFENYRRRIGSRFVDLEENQEFIIRRIVRHGRTGQLFFEYHRNVGNSKMVTVEDCEYTPCTEMLKTNDWVQWK